LEFPIIRSTDHIQTRSFGNEITSDRQVHQKGYQKLSNGTWWVLNPGGDFQIFVIFTPMFGEMIQFDLSIFFN